MGQFTFVAVIVMMALAERLHAAEDFESLWQAYLVKFEQLFWLKFLLGYQFQFIILFQKNVKVNYPLGIKTKSEHGVRKSIFNETHARIKHNSKKGRHFPNGSQRLLSFGNSFRSVSYLISLKHLAQLVPEISKPKFASF